MVGGMREVSEEDGEGGEEGKPHMQGFRRCTINSFGASGKYEHNTPVAATMWRASMPGATPTRSDSTYGRLTTVDSRIGTASPDLLDMIVQLQTTTSRT